MQVGKRRRNNWGGSRKGAGAPEQYFVKRKVFAVWELMERGIPEKKAWQIVGKSIALYELLECHKLLFEIVYIYDMKRLFKKPMGETIYLRLYQKNRKGRKKKVFNVGASIAVITLGKESNSQDNCNASIVSRLDKYGMAANEIAATPINVGDVFKADDIINEDEIDRKLHPGAYKEAFKEESKDGFSFDDSEVMNALDRIQTMEAEIARRSKRHTAAVRMNWEMVPERWKQRWIKEWKDRGVAITESNSIFTGYGELWSEEERGFKEPLHECPRLPIKHWHCRICDAPGLPIERQQYLFCEQLHGNDPCPHYNSRNPLECNVDVCVRCAILKMTHNMHPLLLYRENFGWMCQKCEEEFYKKHPRPRWGLLWGCELISVDKVMFLVIFNEFIPLGKIS